MLCLQHHCCDKKIAIPQFAIKLQEGRVPKIINNLYVGGNSPIEFLNNSRRGLALLQKNNLHLSVAKTII